MFVCKCACVNVCACMYVYTHTYRHTSKYIHKETILELIETASTVCLEVIDFKFDLLMATVPEQKT